METVYINSFTRRLVQVICPTSKSLNFNYLFIFLCMHLDVFWLLSYVHSFSGFSTGSLQMKQAYTTKIILENDSYSVPWFKFCGRPEEKNVSSLQSWCECKVSTRCQADCNEMKTLLYINKMMMYLQNMNHKRAILSTFNKPQLK